MCDEVVNIIVPIYNSESAFNRCITSIIEQTYSNIRIILVDDGSTDGSAELCDSWAVKDNRIIVSHEKNGGVSSARNRGLEFVDKGYVLFVDADDYVADTMIENMVELIEKSSSDAVRCCAKYVYEDRTENQYHIFGDGQEITGKNDIYVKLVIPLITPGDSKAAMLQSACVGLYRTDVIKNNRLLFDEQLSYAEDWLFNIRFFLCCKKVMFTRDIYYFYDRTTKGSLSKSWRNHQFEDTVYISNVLRQLLPEYYENDDFSRRVLWIQLECFRNYVYFNGLRGFNSYAECLFKNAELKTAYTNCKDTPKVFEKARTAIREERVKSYVHWAYSRVYDTAMKYYIRKWISIIKSIGRSK